MPVASRIDALFGMCNAEVKCRGASSHERHASRQVKWIKHTNDRSTLLCNIRPLHRRRTHNDSTNKCWCVLASCQSKQNWRAHSRTSSRERKSGNPSLPFPAVWQNIPGEKVQWLPHFPKEELRVFTLVWKLSNRINKNTKRGGQTQNTYSFFKTGHVKML